jgi:hypothetical protein
LYSQGSEKPSLLLFRMFLQEQSYLISFFFLNSVSNRAFIPENELTSWIKNSSNSLRVKGLHLVPFTISATETDLAGSGENDSDIFYCSFGIFLMTLLPVGQRMLIRWS